MRYLKMEAMENLNTGMGLLMWTVRAECPICHAKHATIFNNKPSLKAVLEAKFLPCSECMKKLEEEARREEQPTEQNIKPE